MSKYKYVDPIDQGYKRFKLSRKNHNKLFPRRKLNIFSKCEYYRHEYGNGIRMHIFDSWLGKIVITLLLPVSILINGLPDTFNDYKRALFQKKHGSFTSDYIQEGSKKFNEIMDTINKS